MGARRSEQWVRHGDRVAQMVAEDVPVDVIAELTGLSQATVYNWISREGWETPAPRPKTNTATTRVLGDVLEAVDVGLAVGSVSMAAIAAECGLSESSVRRIVHKHRHDEWMALRSTPPASKVCTGCQEDLPLDRFPKRADRVDALHAMCFACRVDWSRRYRQSHPEPIREGSRRRRARKRRARTDGYSDADIFERDGGVCWRCGQSIDPSLVHPDPEALSIHHLHPISKGGPDVAKNVVATHWRCNHEIRDRYEPPFRSWAVAPVDYHKAMRLIVEHHYLHRRSNASYSYGLMDDQGETRGIVTLGSPSSWRTAKSAASDPYVVIELNRLWIDDDAPFGVGSWFLSRVLRQMPARIVVAYADTSIMDSRYGSTHEGGIYKACSFHYAGTSAPAVEWRVPGKARNVGKHHAEAVRVEVSPKRRYWTVTGSRSEKRQLRGLCQWPVISDASRV